MPLIWAILFFYVINSVIWPFKRIEVLQKGYIGRFFCARNDIQSEKMKWYEMYIESKKKGGVRAVLWV